jgi:pimeloyl-[acyl-carrier protein] methyl ester esterase
MATIVFAHGWGFDHHLWDGVRSRLDGAHRVETVDFGFFDEPHLPNVSVTEGNPRGTGETVIAVGHSLGACWWLTRSPIAWQRLLVINGFPRFTECAGYAPAVAPRVLARLQGWFAREPQQALAGFHAHCGVAPAAPPSCNSARLAEGLQWLADWDGRAALAQRAADVHVLAGSADRVVRRAMTEMAFAACPARPSWNETPGHVLPLTAPDACARWIEERLA